MIVLIKGTVVYHGIGYIVLERDGIGYKIVLAEDVAHGMSGDVTLYTHEAIRDNEREFFGFTSMSALELFWKLTTVSGVGPRSAQKIVFSSDINNVKLKISEGDITFLTSVPGVGKKTAQKIILELKGVLANEPQVAFLDSDAVDALIGLGYSKKDAELVISKIEADSTEDYIRKALKQISR